jgi:mannose-6-phosphate isomerase
VHAIGAGLVIFEIQQNSDTTFRVFDWNRVGLDKKPRELHVAESLASIDFDDFEPGLVTAEFSARNKVARRQLVGDKLFFIEEFQVNTGADFGVDSNWPRVVAVVKGKILVTGHSVKVSLSPGEFCLIPANVKRANVRAESDGVFLMATAG